GGGGEIRFPHPGAGLRLPATRRDRLRSRPDGDAAGRAAEHPRCHRLPQDPAGHVPADGRAVGGRGGATQGAGDPGGEAGEVDRNITPPPGLRGGGGKRSSTPTPGPSPWEGGGEGGVAVV